MDWNAPDLTEVASAQPGLHPAAPVHTALFLHDAHLALQRAEQKLTRAEQATEVMHFYLQPSCLFC